MVDINNIPGTIQNKKIQSVNVVKCSHCETCKGKEAQAIVVIFEDGYSMVSCPYHISTNNCSYGVNTPRKDSFSKVQLIVLIITLVTAIILVAIGNADKLSTLFHPK